MRKDFQFSIKPIDVVCEDDGEPRVAVLISQRDQSGLEMASLVLDSEQCEEFCCQVMESAAMKPYHLRSGRPL